jgi:hypothetical protein
MKVRDASDTHAQEQDYKLEATSSFDATDYNLYLHFIQHSILASGSISLLRDKYTVSRVQSLLEKM